MEASRFPSYEPVRSVSKNRCAIGTICLLMLRNIWSPVTPDAMPSSITSRASRSGRASASIASAASYPKRCPTIADRMNASAGSTTGTVTRWSAPLKRVSPSLATTIGAALCAR